MFHLRVSPMILIYVRAEFGVTLSFCQLPSALERLKNLILQ